MLIMVSLPILSYYLVSAFVKIKKKKSRVGKGSQPKLISFLREAERLEVMGMKSFSKGIRYTKHPCFHYYSI